MANALYEAMMQKTAPQQNGMMDFITRLNSFAQSLNVDPRQQIQQLMNSGRISQQEYNEKYQQAINMQNDIMRFQQTFKMGPK